MSHRDGVTVYRGGGFSSMVYGVCGVVGVGLICAAGVGVYALNMVDRKIDNVFTVGNGLLHSLPEIRDSLPPVLSDALDDRRAPDYRDQIEVSAKVLPQDDNRTTTILLEATNSGPNMVTLLAVRVNLEDSNGRFVRAESAYVATPLAVEREWAGPILSEGTRRHAIRFHRYPGELTASVEVCDIRVWSNSDRIAGL